MGKYKVDIHTNDRVNQSTYPKMPALTAAKVTIAAPKKTVGRQALKVQANLQQVQKFAAGAALSLAIVAPASAATIKLGGDNGELMFVPPELTVSAGETITFVNNKGFPHNVVFDEDEVPEGVDVDAISHEDYLNGPGDTVTNTFDTPGTYGYYCEPHQGAGMKGVIIVE